MFFYFLDEDCIVRSLGDLLSVGPMQPPRQGTCSKCNNQCSLQVAGGGGGGLDLNRK